MFLKNISAFIKTLLIPFFLFTLECNAEDGYRLWLRYDKIENEAYLIQVKNSIKEINFYGTSPQIEAAKKELRQGLEGLTASKINGFSSTNNSGSLIIGTPQSSPFLASLNITELKNTGEEGFIIKTISSNQKKYTIVSANTDSGILYGIFHFLKLIQTKEYLNTLSIVSTPKLKVRILNHWDNLDRTVERGYAGFSLWDWQKLPDYLDPRYIDYARANASVGINGTVLTNVNANALILTKEFLPKVAALANVFRPYGIKVYLTARFSAPVEIGKLKTADPLDPAVKEWWKKKVDEVYSYIPDFGGFLVKANSEGQPGPQNYGRNHADGANMLAEALAPHNGIVMWRAFVYDNNVPQDRGKQAYNEFKPLDGKFLENVFVQVKNGAIDFQPREPFHPLFGAMPKTPLMMEFQITKEYLGFATHLVYLSPLFKETLNADTYAKGKGSTVAKVIDGTLDNHQRSGIAGVANIGTDRNWCGHPFGQANWYAFGRLAWDHSLSSEEIAREWLKMTFTNDKSFVEESAKMMILSREAVVNYMTPLGLAHMMGYSHHYGPAPWIKNKQREDWTSVYYHKADSLGIGFDRTAEGSKALEQYSPEVAAKFGNLKTCPEEYLLWFHHLSWDYKMKSGRTLWEELVRHYYQGVEDVRQMQKKWDQQKDKVDEQRFEEVKTLLQIQEKEAKWWRNACVLYFQSFSKRPIPAGLEKPEGTLEEYQSMEFHHVPGN
jgi:alpha-glucuronidase